MAIREILMQQDLALTPSEEKIVRLLLAEYPVSGLGTATSLARRAGVSDPTVVRLVMKLGFDGFPDFQSRLLAEVESRLHSPLLMMESKRPGRQSGNVVLDYLDSVGKVVEKSASLTPLQSYERAARLLMEAKGEILLLGGRFSRFLAGIIAGHLMQFRANVTDLGALSAQTIDVLVDMDRKDVLVVFDYRRYQLDVVAFARQAAANGVAIILFTDQWLSPVAGFAEVTIVSPLEVPSPYDTLAPALAQAEALIAQIVSTLGDDARRRIERLEEVRRANEVTLDEASQDISVTDAGRAAGDRPARKARRQNGR